MFWFGRGGDLCTYLASGVIEGFGPRALFTMISVRGMGGWFCSGLTRNARAPTSEQNARPYVYAPRTSFPLAA